MIYDRQKTAILTKVLFCACLSLLSSPVASARNEVVITGAQELANLRNPIYTNAPLTPANKTLPLKQLDAAMEAFNYDRVDELLSQVKETKVNANALHLWRGLAFSGHQRYEEAVEQFDRCTNFDDAAFCRLYIVGTTYFKLEECEKCVKAVSIVLAKYPSRDCYSCRANAYVAMKKHNEAIADYMMAAKWSHTYHSVYLSRAANVLRIEKRYPEALDLYADATKNTEDNFLALSLLGRALCYQETKKWELAVKDCTAAIKILNTTYTSDMKMTHLSDAYVCRAKSYDRLGKATLAAADRQAHAKIGAALANEFLDK